MRNEQPTIYGVTKEAREILKAENGYQKKRLFHFSIFKWLITFWILGGE